MARQRRQETEDMFTQIQESVDQNQGVLASWREQERRMSAEDRYKRATFLVEHELLDRLNSISSGQKRGFKTWLINQAIADILDQIEDDL